MSRIQHNTKEIDLLARLMKAEALGEGDEGMLLVGNVIVNRVAARCDVFNRTQSITEVVYQENAFAGVDTHIFNQPLNGKERELAERVVDGYRMEPAYYALWFRNPGTDVPCPATFYGNLSGRFKNHCFYNTNLNCDLY